VFAKVLRQHYGSVIVIGLFYPISSQPDVLMPSKMQCFGPVEFVRALHTL
jgi:hypothetical protein